MIIIWGPIDWLHFLVKGQDLKHADEIYDQMYAIREGWAEDPGPTWIPLEEW